VIDLRAGKGILDFIGAAKRGRIWARETVRGGSKRAGKAPVPTKSSKGAGSGRASARNAKR
jgi:hypothetical protein